MLRLFFTYVRANAQSALEYRSSFLTQFLAMVLSNSLWLAFWVGYFQRFPLARGWGETELVVLWALVATSFGLATTFFGNAPHLASMIAGGQLDFYLTLPKPVLFHLLIGRMSFTAPGDIAFGLGVFAFFGHASPLRFAVFVGASLAAAALVVGFFVLVNSLTFWLGRGEGAAGQLANALIVLSTYPTQIFNGITRVILFTVVPAGFVALVPVELVREVTWTGVAELLGGVLVFCGLGFVLFTLGLRRYESGNLIVMHE